MYHCFYPVFTWDHIRSHFSKGVTGHLLTLLYSSSFTGNSVVTLPVRYSSRLGSNTHCARILEYGILILNRMNPFSISSPWPSRAAAIIHPTCFRSCCSLQQWWSIKLLRRLFNSRSSLKILQVVALSLPLTIHCILIFSEGTFWIGLWSISEYGILQSGFQHASCRVHWIYLARTILVLWPYSCQDRHQ